MGTESNASVFQLGSGMWAFRYTYTRNGKRVSKQVSKDENGNPLKNRRAAIKARQAAIDNAQNSRRPKPTVRKTVQEVYQEYCTNGRNDRAYTTKQDSLWKNHLCARFGERYIDEISAAEVVDYLTELYCSRGLSYRYVEGFLKMFYLLFGQAYSRDYLAVDSYNKLCVNKDTKIHMPKLKVDDDLDIVSFSREELAVLDDYFHGTNAETAYLLGRYCGLRINECYGLKWSNVDLKNGTILIDRQMQYQQGRIKLVSLKTRNAKRTIQMCDKLKVYFQGLAERREQDQLRLADLREQNQRIIEDLDGSKISSTELVNCLPDGKIRTVNSMKFHTREVKAGLSPPHNVGPMAIPKFTVRRNLTNIVPGTRAALRLKCFPRLTPIQEYLSTQISAEHMENINTNGKPCFMLPVRRFCLFQIGKDFSLLWAHLL